MATNPRPDAIDSWPVQLAIRQVLDSVCYSNPLPDWFEVHTINYSARDAAIKRRIRAYLAGARPDAPFTLNLPRRSGEAKRWSVPSVNDQMVLQTCVCSIAERLYDKRVDRQRVFSYRYNRDGSSLAFTEDPISSWRAFQNETQRRCASGGCVLQVDIEDAFHSIDRGRFLQSLRDQFPGAQEVQILEMLLNSLAAGAAGLPLVNDSVFFLGNAYLSVVDNMVTRHTSNFFRFVDDYRVFGQSQTELQNVAQSLGGELQDAGFRINAHKLKLSTGEEYLQALAQIRYAEKESDGARNKDVEEDINEDYARATTFNGIIPPDKMVAQIEATLGDPEARLHDGAGRLLMASLRRARLDALVLEDHSDGDNGNPALRKHFIGQLSKNRSMVERITELLNQYASQPGEVWRMSWLLYLVKDIDFEAAEPRASAALQTTLARIRTSQVVPTVAQLWADKNTPATGGEIERLHTLGYIDSGKLLVQGGPRA